MKRRIITLILAAALLAVPLMGAKGCSTAPPQRRSGSVDTSEGYPVRVGGELSWVGRVPPKPLPGYEWKIGGWTKRNHVPIWVRRYKR